LLRAVDDRRLRQVSAMARLPAWTTYLFFPLRRLFYDLIRNYSARSAKDCLSKSAWTITVCSKMGLLEHLPLLSLPGFSVRLGNYARDTCFRAHLAKMPTAPCFWRWPWVSRLVSLSLQ